MLGEVWTHIGFHVLYNVCYNMWVKRLVVWMICMVVLDWTIVGFLNFQSCACHRYWTLFVESFNVRCIKIRLQVFMTDICVVSDKRYTHGGLWEVHNMKISWYAQSTITKLLILIQSPQLVVAKSPQLAQSDWYLCIQLIDRQTHNVFKRLLVAQSICRSNILYYHLICGVRRLPKGPPCTKRWI